MVASIALRQPSENGPLQNNSIQSIQSEKKPTRNWIYGPARDFWLLHGGLGLIILPVVAASYLAPQALTPILIMYTLFLGLPHLTATYVRLHLDEDCQQNQRWLAVAAPVVVAALVATVVYSWKLLPVLVFFWFCLQSWHANRQNFGIMRRYIRMAGSDPKKLVNRLAEAGAELFPWAAVTTAMMVPNKNYFNYPISIPPVEMLFPVLVTLWTLAIAVFVIYSGFEIFECSKGRAVPGRALCFYSGAIINFTAWVLVEDLVWGYLVVSTWHALQYISYVNAFRTNPPPSARVLKLASLPHISMLFGGGLLVYFFSRGLELWLPSALVVVHLGMNFHHYLSDAFIWRAPKPVPAPGS